VPFQGFVFDLNSARCTASDSGRNRILWQAIFSPFFSIPSCDDVVPIFSIFLAGRFLKRPAENLKNPKQNRAVLGGATSVVHRCRGSGRGANPPETDGLGLKEV
jgi:hypothetical protein